MSSEFEKRLRNELVDTESRLDNQTTRQLNAARRRALEARGQRHTTSLKDLLWPAAGMVTASLLVFTVLLSPVSPVTPADKFAADNVSIEFENDLENELIEDLDFYYWLAENEANLKG